MINILGLKIIEILNNSSAYLGNTNVTRGILQHSNLNLVPRPRELDYFRLAGLYHHQKLSVEITEVQLNEDEQQGSEAYLLQSKRLSNAVLQSLNTNNFPLTLGGTCTTAPGVAGGLRRFLGKEARIGLVWLDAHGDLNIPDTSPSGMLGGMPCATILGYCLPEWRAVCGLEPPLDDQFAVHSDARSFDKEEKDNVRNRPLTMLDTAQFCNEDFWLQTITDLAAKVDVIYLHIDADIVDSKYLPSVNTPEPNGPDLWTLCRNIETVMNTKKVIAATVASIYFDNIAKTKDPGTAILSGLCMINSITKHI